MTVWVCPELLTHWSCTESPGCRETSALLRSVAEVMVDPLRVVMTSPWTSPALAAGEPDRVPSTVAPDVVAPLLPLPEPSAPGRIRYRNRPRSRRRSFPEAAVSISVAIAPSPVPLLLLDASTLTPRNPVAPMWTTVDALPASICLAMVSAVWMGMA